MTRALNDQRSSPSCGRGAAPAVQQRIGDAATVSASAARRAVQRDAPRRPRRHAVHRALQAGQRADGGGVLRGLPLGE